MTEPTEVAGVGPFETTVDAVYALCPEAERVTDPSTSTLPTPITERTVEGWIHDVSAAVDAGIGPWGLIVDEDATDRVMAAGRAVVANGVASYLSAARYPTRAGLNDSSYAGVLWARYEAGLAALAAVVADQLPPGAVVDPGVGVDSGGVYASFPCTTFADRIPW